MAWALQGFKLPGARLSSLQHPLYPPKLLARTTHSPLNMINKPGSHRNVPVLTQQSFFSSSSYGPRFQSGFRPGSKKSLLLYPTPALAGYSTLIGTIGDMDSSKNECASIAPCDLTVGAAWAPKRPRSNLPPWCVADCGEDAFFTLLVNNNYCLGVADGVGGWGDVGVDPSQFAWELMNNCKSQCDALGMVRSVNPKQVLTIAYEKLVKSGRVKAGSSTACIAVVDTETGRLKSVNLGDSGYVILRNGTVAYRSSETTHYFNAPYQLAVIPPELDKGGHIRNTPSEGQEATLQLEHGDIIVMGTDGLFDNLFHRDIEALAQSTRPNDLDALLLKSDPSSQAAVKAYTNAFAGALVKQARVQAKDRNKASPFSTEAAKHGYRFKGGKMDDITVLTALVTMKKPIKSRI